jgi:hypothetical protein
MPTNDWLLGRPVKQRIRARGATPNLNSDTFPRKGSGYRTRHKSLLFNWLRQKDYVFPIKATVLFLWGVSLEKLGKRDHRIV